MTLMNRSTSLPDEVLDVVAKRVDLLSELQSGPQRRSTLQKDCDISRSTAYTALKELTEYSLVTRTEDGYRLTLYGQVILEKYLTLQQQVGKLSAARDGLEPLSEVPDAERLLQSDPTIVTPTDCDPDRPVDVFEELVRGADKLVGFSPITRSRYVSLFGTCILDGELTASLINETSVVEYLLENHHDDFEAVVTADHVDFYTTDADLPFGLLVVQSPTPMVVCNLYDNQHTLQTLVYNDDPDAVTWGREIFEAERTRSSPVTQARFE